MLPASAARLRSLISRRPSPPRRAAIGLAVVAPPAGATLKVPPGFKIEQFAAGLENPRLIRVAPNGDIFIAESSSNRMRVMRAADGAEQTGASEIFASGSRQAVRNRILAPRTESEVCLYRQYRLGGAISRIRSGDLHARGPAETVVPSIPSGGHLTGRRSLDARRGFLPRWIEDVRLGRVTFERCRTACAQSSANRKNIAPTCSNSNRTAAAFAIFASGIRNCVGDGDKSYHR